ncbi:hypothetical protein BDY19DRAFT_915760 [Irpex rosettiformis]|uniref:Uncharacterized protein n=1 Tax=Irpex rosettiformis TaxID=378272 RepID=A0ACB8UKT5_9APHY|nr:hypothetical protein BDY19DRAFT_915760 [Irpex rosettiformis]
MESSTPRAVRTGRSLSRAAARKESQKDYITGICLLLVVVFLWTASNFITQDLFDDGFDAPFWITYLNTSSFALYLIPIIVKYLVKQAKQSKDEVNRGRPREGYEPVASNPHAADVSETVAAELLEDHIRDADAEALTPLTVVETAQLAGWFCLLWFIANWTLAVGLRYTTVASATILSSMSGFFTLAIGRLFRVETLTLVKIFAVCTSFGGVVLVSLSDSSEAQGTPPSSGNPVNVAFGRAPIVGDSLALLSAFVYAMYVTFLKVRVREESRVDMQLFFGFVGLFNIVACLPIGLFLHVIHMERFTIPSSKRAVVGILVNMGITLSSDYIYVLAMLKTTPLVVTVGLSLTMPLAVVGDFILHKPVKLQVIIGAAVVLLSFVIVGVENMKEDKEPDLISGRPLDQSGASDVRLEEEVGLEASHTDS